MNNITISQRQFPFRVRADLQRAIDRLFGDTTRIQYFCGVRRDFSHDGVTLSDCIVERQHSPALSTPPEYEELDIGEGKPIRVLKNGLWLLLVKDGVNFAVLLAPVGHYGRTTGMQFQIASPNAENGTKVTQEFFSHLEDSILKSKAYRGKILSLEHRSQMNSPCEEVLLNKLLNEMDGLKEEADILFILTTNRPEALEAALAARPGRVDQAIEFPLPDQEGRTKLVRLYSQGVSLSEVGIVEITKRTEGVSASFIKELMRRVVQFHIEADGTGMITHTDIDNALGEMLFKGGMLNLKLLGAKAE